RLRAREEASVIRPAGDADFEAMWSIFHDVVATGDTYVFAANTSRADAFAYWFGPGISSFVAEIDGRIVGMCKFMANRRDRGAHVAKASFRVAPRCAGRGVGRSMALHCLRAAKRAGFTAMQFNFVVSTNRAAVKLWESLGFVIVGTLPRAFQHATLGYV